METVLGFAIMLAGAVCGGSFGLPSKYVRKGTPWEVLWGPFFLFVTILIPTILGPVIVKDFFAVFGEAGFAAMVPVLLFGLLWGAGSMTLGMSFAFIGLSLAYALNYGLQIATGAMVPMLIHSPGAILTGKGLVVIGGVVACLLGVVASGRAAMLKERDQRAASDDAETDGGVKKPRMMIGVVIAVVSGVLCACYAVAASFAGDVGTAATALGNQGYQATWAVMAVIVWGGAVSACLYCLVQLVRNKTWGHFARPGIGLTLVLALVMAILHDGAIFLFGLGYQKLGDLGISVGYAVFMSFAILVGNFHGFRTGEWKGAGRDSICWLLMGVASLVLGVYILGVGNSM